MNTPNIYCELRLSPSLQQMIYNYHITCHNFIVCQTYQTQFVYSLVENMYLTLDGKRAKRN